LRSAFARTRELIEPEHALWMTEVRERKCRDYNIYMLRAMFTTDEFADECSRSISVAPKTCAPRLDHTHDGFCSACDSKTCLPVSKEMRRVWCGADVSEPGGRRRGPPRRHVRGPDRRDRTGAGGGVHPAPSLFPGADGLDPAIGPGRYDAFKAMSEFIVGAADGQVERAASKFVVAMAGELAIEYGIVPWPKGGPPWRRPPRRAQAPCR
jgi:hypothetical protein